MVPMSETQLTAHDVTYEQVAKTIDHSLLKPELTVHEVVGGCDLAARYHVASVCCRPSDVVRANRALAGSDVLVGTVIGFPHGSNTTAVKVFEAERALTDGAVELDMVLNIAMLRSGEHAYVEDDIAAVVKTAESGGAIVKVILENAFLTDDEKARACQIVERAGGHYVKTSTGYAHTGATIADLRLMRDSVSSKVKIKAAGGVRTLDALLEVMSVPAQRCGATATAAMLDDYRSRTGR